MKRRVVLGLLIGAAALVLALWGVPLQSVGVAMSGAQPAWFVLVALLFFAQQSLRALRQSLLLTGAPAGGGTLSFRRSLSVLCISFLFINTLPARLGEIVRPTLLWEREGVPFGRAVAMVVVERVLDLASAIAMLGSVAAFVPVASATLEIGGVTVPWAALGRTAAGVMLPSLLAGLVALLVAGRPLLGVGTRWLPRVPVWGRRPLGLLLRFGAGFVDGLEAVRSPGRLAAIVGLTVVTWSLSGWMFVAGARAFGLGVFIRYGQGIGLLSITMLGTAVPSAPGFAGTYEAFLRGGLVLFGVHGPELDAKAVAFALSYHWWVYGVQACTALFFLAVDRVNPAALWRKAAETWRGA